MNKARITYRFDQNRKTEGARKSGYPNKQDKVIALYEEEFEIVPQERKEAEDPGKSAASAHQDNMQQVESLFESNALNTFTTDFGSWASPIETESERVERIIRESQTAKNGQAPSERSRPVQGEIPGPHQETNEPQDNRNPDDWSSWTGKGPWVEHESTARYAKSTGASWFRIATSIAGAVITGVAFGFFVLSMFTTDDQQSDTAAAVNAGSTSVTGQQTSSSAQSSPDAAAAKPNADQATAAAAGGTMTAVQIPAKTFSFLQNGVFSTAQSAQTAQAELEKKGLASAVEGTDKVTVFAGFALDRDDALALSQQLQEKKVEVYIKTVEIPAVSGIRWSGTKPESVGSYINEGDKLVQMISGLTLAHLNEAAPTALEDSSMQSLRSAHQAMTNSASAVTEGLNDPMKSRVQNMTTAINSAVQSMEEYKKSPSAAMLWQAQSSLMQYILAEKELLKEAAAS